MDIAALSMSISQMNVQQQASTSMLKKSMDMASTQTDALLEMMSSAPSFGHKLDVRA